MAAELWYPKATRFPVGRAGTLNRNGTKRCTLHTTENDPSQTTAMDVAKWMQREKPGSVYTLIYHCISGETVQMLSAGGSAKSLTNVKGGVETNRMGSVHIQVSVVARAARPFTLYPMPGWSEVVDWVTSHGVPRRWSGPPPMGKLDHVSHAFWTNTSGWFGHCCVPENYHHDPGAVDLSKLLGQAPPTQPPAQPSGNFALAYEGDGTMSLRVLQNKSPDMTGGDVKSLQALLNAKGFNAGAVDGIFGNGTEAAVKRAQAKYKIAVDGVVAAVTHEKLWEG
jgi:Putative peptidoglycan binding domain